MSFISKIVREIILITTYLLRFLVFCFSIFTSRLRVTGHLKVAATTLTLLLLLISGCLSAEVVCVALSSLPASFFVTASSPATTSIWRHDLVISLPLFNLTLMMVEILSARLRIFSCARNLRQLVRYNLRGFLLRHASIRNTLHYACV